MDYMFHLYGHPSKRREEMGGGLSDDGGSLSKIYVVYIFLDLQSTFSIYKF